MLNKGMTTKYAQDYYNFLALMCLVHCLLPPVPLLDFQFSKSIRRLPPESSLKNRIRETPFDNIIFENPWNRLLKIDSLFDKITTDRELTGSNISAYIYTEIEHVPTNAAVGRRNLAENSTFGAAAGRVVNELSLEDIDLIDCLWRQDIDAEKGVFSSIQPPEYQYQTDLVVLSEKNVLQSNRLQLSVVDREISPEIDSDRGFLSTEDYKYLKQTLMGDFSAIDSENGPAKVDPLFSDYDNALWRNNNREVSCRGAANNGTESDFSNLNNILHNNTMDDDAGIDAKNTTIQPGVGNSHDEGYESNDLSSPFNEFFNEKHGEMLAFWDDSPENNVSPMQRLSESSMASLNTQPDFIAAVPSVIQPARSFTPFSDHSSSNSYLSSSNTTDFQTGDRFSAQNQCFWFGNSEPSTSTGHRSTTDFHATSSVSLSSRSQNIDSQSSSVLSTSPFYRSAITGDEIIHDHTYFSINGDENFIRHRPVAIEQENVETGDENLHIIDAIKEEIVDEEEISSTTHNVWVGAEEIAPPSTSLAMFRYQTAVSLGIQQPERQQIFAPSRRDEDLLRQYRITLSAWDINNMPAEELQRLLNVGGYSPGQSEIIRAVRRRGRNKVAAQFCRQRRYDAVRRLETEVEILQHELDVLSQKQEKLLKEKDDELRAIQKLSAKNKRPS
uniref:BZIP domain-containing protein n=1 Tax=Romanomermis culicivorax TaxID=13658 RepID=A0A915HGW2_ROMCU